MKDFWDDFRKEQAENARRSLDRFYEQQAMAQTQAFQREMTDRVIDEYKSANQRLEEINSSLKAQLEETKKQAEDAKNSARHASIRAWISIGVSILAIIASVFIGVIF